MDTLGYREFFGQLPTGVTAIVAAAAHGPVGLVVGTFASVSMEPPLVSFMVTRGSRSWAAVRSVGRFAANILASDQRRLSQALSGWSPDKFRHVEFVADEPGVIRGSLAWADCVLEREVEAGDHLIVLATPHAFKLARAARPLIFFQRAYHRTLAVEDGHAHGWT